MLVGVTGPKIRIFSSTVTLMRVHRDARGLSRPGPGDLDVDSAIVMVHRDPGRINRRTSTSQHHLWQLVISDWILDIVATVVCPTFTRSKLSMILVSMLRPYLRRSVTYKLVSPNTVTYL